MKHFLLISAVSAATFPHAGFTQDQLDEIVVTSSRVETPVRQLGTSVSVLTAEDIQLKGYASTTDLLRTQVGITATNNGGQGKVSAVRIRGEEGYRTLFLIDGIDVSDSSAPQVMPLVQHLGATNDIERIEILRGPQGFIYGADAGGVVNMFTRRVDDGIQGQVSAEQGRYDTQNINGFVGAGSELFDVFFSATDQFTEGYNTRTSDVSGERDGYDNRTLHTKLGANINEKLRAQLVVRDIDATTEYDNCGFPSSNACVSTHQQTIGRLSFNYSTEHLSHSVGVSKSDIERVNYTDGQEAYAASGDIETIDYIGRLTFSDSLTWVAGADYQQESVDVTGADDLSQDQLGVLTELQFQLNEQLYFNIGTRWDNNEDFGEHFSHRLSLAYLLPLGSEGNTLKLRSSYGTGFRAPSPNEIATNENATQAPASITTLKEETSKGIDIGADIYFINGSEISFTYFNQEINNEISYDLISYSGYIQEDGETQSTGIELGFIVPLAHFLDIQGNALYNDTETKDRLQRIRRPKRSANLGLKFHLLDDQLTILSNYRISRDSVDEIFSIGRVALDDYSVWDLSVNYTTMNKFNLFARIENLTNEDYEEITGFNSSGRAGYAGIRYNF